MQRSEQKALAQPIVMQPGEDSHANDNGQPFAGDCDHRWRFLMPGFQMCTSCGAIRRKPKNGSEGAAPRGTPHAVLAPAMVRARELSRRHGRVR